MTGRSADGPLPDRALARIMSMDELLSEFLTETNEGLGFLDVGRIYRDFAY